MNSPNVDSMITTTMRSNENIILNFTSKQSQLKFQKDENSKLQLKEHNGTYPQELQISAEKIFKSKELYIVLFLCFPIVLWAIVHFCTKMCC